MKEFTVLPVPDDLAGTLQRVIDSKTKPTGSLGMLEEIAMRIALTQGTLTPRLTKPAIIIFAGDHGIAAEGVSAYPPSVTSQMVFNFLQGGAAINVLSRQNHIFLRVVDAGVNHDFPPHEMRIGRKIAKSTRNFLHENAMTLDQATEAIAAGSDALDAVSDSGCNIVGFGEMGIGNTSSASLLMSVLCSMPLSECVGRGTGLDDDGLMRKIAILEKAASFHTLPATPLDALVHFGGFEIAQMCGAMLRAAERRMTILVDGFIASVAFLVALKLHVHVKDYAIFAHRSDEHAHSVLLQYIGVHPVLDLKLRLGEGTGCALVFPLIESAVAILREMASFESAGVSRKVE
jgi:nicotinate-nucleotide--dimethylbenzimidazole phosphoribosyltransferase